MKVTVERKSQSKEFASRIAYHLNEGEECDRCTKTYIHSGLKQ